MTGNFFAWAGYLFLIFLRVISTFALSPIFGRSVPNVVKIVLSMMISYIVITVFPPHIDLAYNNLLEYIVFCAREIIIGFIISIIIIMFFSLVHTAGQIIDIQLGFSFAQMYSSEFNSQMPLTGTFLNIILVIMFFLTDSHHILIQLIYLTFEKVPPGIAVFTTDSLKVLVEVFIKAFTISVRIAMPILVASLSVEVLLGIVMKAVPQMNYFVIGFPIKIFMGLLVMVAFIPVFVNMSDYMFKDMFDSIQKIIEGLSI